MTIRSQGRFHQTGKKAKINLEKRSDKTAKSETDNIKRSWVIYNQREDVCFFCKTPNQTKPVCWSLCRVTVSPAAVVVFPHTNTPRGAMVDAACSICIYIALMTVRQEQFKKPYKCESRTNFVEKRTNN